MDQLLEPGAQPLVGDAHRPPQAAERGRGAVEDLAGRVDAHLEPLPQRRQGRRWPATARGAAAAPRRGARRASRAGRHERVRDGHQLARLEPTAAIGAPDGRRRCRARRRCRPPAAPTGSSRASSVSSSSARHDDRVGRRLERLGQPARRRERGVGREPRADRRGTRGAPRSGRPSAAVAGLSAGKGRDSDGCPRSPKRHGRVGPVRPGVVDADARPASTTSAVAAPRRSGRQPRATVGPVGQVVAVRAAVDGQSGTASAGPPASRSSGAAVVAAGAPHGAEPATGSRARMSTADGAARPGPRRR